MHTRRPSAPRRHARILALAAATVAAPAALHANETWDGGGANADFNTPANWGGDALPANNGTANLLFTGSVPSSATLNMDWFVNSVTFDSATTHFTLSGPSMLRIGAGGISNTAGLNQTITAPISTAGSTTFSSTTSTLSLGSVALATGSTLTVASDSLVKVDFLGGDADLTKTGTGTLHLTGTSRNSYFGTTTVNGGVLHLEKHSSVGGALNGPVVVNAGGTVRVRGLSQIRESAPITLNGGTLDLTTYTAATSAALTMTAGFVIAAPEGALNLAAGVTTNAAAGPSVIAANVNLSGGTRTFAVADGVAPFDLDLSGAVTNGTLLKTGPGTLRISGPSAGNSFGTIVNQGTVLLDKAAGVFATNGDITVTGSGSVASTQNNALNPNTYVALSTSGTFAVGSASFSALNASAVGGFGPGTYTLNSYGTALTLGQGIGLSNPIVLTSPAGGGILYAGSAATPAPSSVSGAIDLGNVTRSVGVQGTSTDYTRDGLTLSGVVSNGGLAVSTPGFDGVSYGVLALTAANTYAGGTSVTNAVLHVSADANLGTGPLTLAGGTLRTSASFSTARPITLNAASGLSPDAGTTLTLTGSLSGPGPLVVNSPGTLVLPNSSALTGGITVSNAILVPTSPASLGSGTLTLNSGTFRPAGAAPISFANNLRLRPSSLNPATFDGPDTTFTGPVTLQFPSTIAVNNNLTLTGVISDNAGAFGLTKRGTGTLTLTNHNTFTGPLSIEQGTVTLPAPSTNGYVNNYATLNAGGFGATVATLNNYGTLNLTGGELTTYSFNNFSPAALPPNFTLYSYTPGTGVNNQSTLTLNNATLAGNAPVLNQGLLTGAGTINTTSSFTNTGQLTPTGPLYLSATASNSGSIDLPTGGQLVLNAPLTSTGTITLAGGSLTGTGPLTLSPGSVLTGRGTVAVTMLNAGTLAPSGGTLYVSTGFVNAGLVQLSSATASLNGASLVNTGTVQGIGSVGNPLANGETGVIEAIGGGTLALPNLTANSGLLAASAGNKLLVAGLASNAGTVSLTGGTLDTNGHALTNIGSITGFGTLRASTLTNTGTVTLTGGLSTVNAALVNSPGATVKVLHNPAIFTAPVTNNGTLTVTNTTATFAAGLFSSAPSTPAALSFSGEPAAPSSPSPLAGTLTLTPAASALTNYIRQDTVSSSGSLTIRPTAQGGDTSAINALTLSPGSSFDLADTRLILSSAATPIHTLRAYLLNARLFSSTAANDPQHLLALGYVDNALLNAPTWGSLPADASNLLVKLTSLGDANLDGRITPDDYALLDRGFAKHLATWSDGDFNYDGTVTPADYLLIDRTYTLQSGTYSPDPALLSQRESQFGTAYVSELIASVPEPSSLFAAGGLALLPLTRRRR